MADLRINVSADDKASGKIDNVKGSLGSMAGEAVKSAAKAMAAALAFQKLAQFAMDGVKALAEEEVSTRRLTMALGPLAESMGAYADAVEKSTGVDKVKVEQMALLLARYGQAPGEIQRTIKAVLDYSAATGEDAVRSTEEMISSVDKGRRAFKDVGLQYDDTGGKSEQLSSVTDALGKRFAGAAKDEANTLAGRARLASASFEDLKKSFASLIVEIESRYGVLKTANSLLAELNYFAGGQQGVASKAMSEARAENLRQSLSLVEQEQAVLALLADVQNQPAHLVKGARSKLESDLAEIRKAMGVLDDARKPEKTEDSLTTAQLKEQEAAQEKARGLREAAQKQRLADSERYAKEIADALNRGEDELAASREKMRDEQERDQEQAREKEMAALQKHLDERERLEKDAAQMRADMMRQEEQRAAQMGAAIGSAFANALASQINKLAAGEEMSMEEMLIDIIVGAGSVALAAFGGPVGMALTPVLGALGNVAKSQIVKKHSGGWIDAPRFHSGAWVGSDERPAILQTGERVLSRQEVASMGGSRAVDGAARGGGGVTVNVSTLDGSTAREYFERAGGRALLNAVRTGRGAPTLLFGGG